MSEFQIGDKVEYIKEMDGWDHGKHHRYGQTYTGLVKRTKPYYDDGYELLVERADGAREWVGEWDCKKI